MKHDLPLPDFPVELGGLISTIDLIMCNQYNLGNVFFISFSCGSIFLCCTSTEFASVAQSKHVKPACNLYITFYCDVVVLRIS